ncbi:MAG: hypothetical protein EAZ27_07985 [Cytophagales bacterium]|nr:MAG: hypothetical protein EAZ27_07985 [Cytophagales bacterium]
MRKIVIILSLVMMARLGFGQINLGKDTTFCSSLVNPQIGTKLTITGGSLNVFYTWSCKYILGNRTYTASNFLNNTTVASPIVSNLPSNEWLKFILTVFQNSNIYKDSINIRVSQFAYTTGFITRYLSFGDSIELNSTQIGGGITPLKFLKWEPSTGIKKPFSNPAFYKQVLTPFGQSLQIDAYVTDSVGCEGSNMAYEIRFQNPSSLNDIELSKTEIFIRNGELNFTNENQENVSVSIYKTSGEKVLSLNTDKSKVSINALKADLNEVLICYLYFNTSKKNKTIKFLSL